jgi:putative protease
MEINHRMPDRMTAQRKGDERGKKVLCRDQMAEPLPRRLPELLAPAGSMEALRAAVSCGADAVYLGGKRFSARQYAENFDDRELARAVDFAHGRGVRIYAAVNTLLHDREIPEAAKYLLFLSEIGVDAVLVQDPGLAHLAREVIPGLPLHASTQMTLHNSAGLEWAASLGMKRVVLARELSLAEVEAMGKTAGHLGIGLEVFVHGALCYSYSGQCLLSSAIGGRSGNRGRCAQPCRRPYTLVRGAVDEYGRPGRSAPVLLGDRYLLSTRDLSLYPYLDRVVRAPVAALKIEGRMRSPEYVGVVTGIYRKALDAIAEGTWTPSPGDEEALALTFSRGFTGGCLCEGLRGIMGRDASGHRGILVGIVDSLDERSGSIAVRLTGSTIPEKGDGLAFRAQGGEGEAGMILREEPAIHAGVLWLKVGRGKQPGSDEERGKGIRAGMAAQGIRAGMAAQGIRAGMAAQGIRAGMAAQGIRAGARVFITRRARLSGASGCFSPTTSIPPKSRIRVDLALRVREDRRPFLEGSVFRSGEPVSVIRREAGFAVEPARARVLSGEEVREILSRRADSPYLIGMVSVDWPPGSYARKGDIGRLRRDLLAEVERTLLVAGRPEPGEVSMARERLRRALGEEGSLPAGSLGRRTPGTPVILTDTLEGVDGIVEDGSGHVALEPSRSGGVLPGETLRSENLCDEAKGILREAAAMVRGTGWSLLWKWPRITGDPWIRGLGEVLDGKEAAGLSGLMVEGAGAALAARSLFPGLPLHGGPGLNVWNALAARLLSPAFHSITLSPELSREDLGDLVPWTAGRGNPPRLGFFVEGNLEVMVSEDRLAGLLPERRGRDPGRQFIGIQDGTSRIFPVGADICGRTRISNSVETCLIDQLPVLSTIGIGLYLIDARGRGRRYGQEMAAIYGEALSLVEAGGDRMKRGLGELREECRKRARGGITRGAFLEGLREDE